MKLQKPYKSLGPVSGFEPLRSAVLKLPDHVWLKDQSRQEVFSNVHGSTQTLVLLFCDGWPEVDVEARSSWELLGEEALSVMSAIVRNHYNPGGRVIRAMVAKLPAGAKIQRHYDAHPSFNAAHRIHVPIVTHPNVEFLVDNQKIDFVEGQAYEIDNIRMHEVHNHSPIDRLHFIFDYAPAESLKANHAESVRHD